MATLGKTTAGAGESGSSSNKVVISKHTASSSGTLTVGHARLYIDSGSTNVNAVIYADSAGTPGALLAQSDTVVLSNNTLATVDFVFSGANKISISSGVDYWVGVSWQDPGTQFVNYARDNTANQRVESNNYLPNPISGLASLTGPLAAWVEYSIPTSVTGTAAASLGFGATATGKRTVHGVGVKSLGFGASASGTASHDPGVPLLPNILDGRLAVEIAWGADLSNPGSWVWSDISRDVRIDPAISTSLGRSDEQSTSSPASCVLVVDNSSGGYSKGGQSPNYPNVRRGTPVRIRVDGGEGLTVLFQGYADGFTPSWDSLGTIPVVTISASGTLRRLEQGSAPVPSAFRRAMTENPAIIAYWPVEEGKDARFAGVVRGGTPLYFNGAPKFEADESFACSRPLPQLATGNFLARVTPYTATGENQIRFLLSLPDNGATDGTVLARVWCTGTIARWDVTYVTYDSGTKGGLRVTWYDRNGTQIGTDALSFSNLNGTAFRASLAMLQSGTTVFWLIGQFDEAATNYSYYEGSISNQTCGIVDRIEIAPNGDGGDIGFGHLTLETLVTVLYSSDSPLAAFRTETATGTGRFFRLGQENDIDISVIGSLESLNIYDRMGPQLPESLLHLLRECETSDQGQLFDGRGPGLTYVTRRYIENANTVLTLDAADLAPGFSPTDDDQRTRNKVSVTRLRGSSATYEDRTGPMGTQVIGTYDSSATVNNYADSMAIQYAGWFVHLGTNDDYRYPSVTLNLRAVPHLAAQVLDATPGDRIVIHDLEGVFAGFAKGDAQLVVEGISHDISTHDWFVTFSCSPFKPWAVGRIAEESGDTGEFVMRLDGNSTLSANASQGATSLSVTGTWTTDSDDYPLTLDVDGVEVAATAFSSGTFTIQPLPLARPLGSQVSLKYPGFLGL